MANIAFRIIFRFFGAGLGLILFAGLIVWALQMQNSDFRDRAVRDIANAKNKLSQNVKFFSGNVKEELAPQRRKPDTLIQQEDELKMMMPQVFRQFSRQDWQNFWSYIYDPIYEGKGIFKPRRYHAKEEIEQHLIKQYPEPFEAFGARQWDAFWQVLGKDRNLKMITYKDQAETINQQQIIDQMN